MNDEKDSQRVTGTSGTVVMTCKGCGKEIIRPEGKVGMLVACSQCHSINRTPGIAMQKRASGLQLARMQKSLRVFRLALWLPFIAIIPLAFGAVLAGVGNWAYLVEIGLVVFLFFCMMEARGFLGHSKGAALLFFLGFQPIWWVMTFSTYFRLKRRIRLLVLNSR